MQFSTLSMAYGHAAFALARYPKVSMQLNPLEILSKILCADFVLYRVLDTTSNHGMFNSQPTNLQLNFNLGHNLPSYRSLFLRRII